MADESRSLPHQSYPGEVLVPEQTTSAHTIRATATPRAVALLVGLLPLRQPRHGESCTVTDSGGAMWHLRGGFVVTLDFDEDGSAMWHLDRDDEEEPRDG
jgi:hypothetical protein